MIRLASFVFFCAFAPSFAAKGWTTPSWMLSRHGWPDHINSNGYYEFQCGVGKTRLEPLGLTLGVAVDNWFCAQMVGKHFSEVSARQGIFTNRQLRSCHDAVKTRIGRVEEQMRDQLNIYLRLDEILLLWDWQPDTTRDYDNAFSAFDKLVNDHLMQRRGMPRRGLWVYWSAYIYKSPQDGGSMTYGMGPLGGAANRGSNFIIAREHGPGRDKHSSFQHELQHSMGAHHFYNQRRGDGIFGGYGAPTLENVAGTSGIVQLHPYHELDWVHQHRANHNKMCATQRRLRQLASGDRSGRFYNPASYRKVTLVYSQHTAGVRFRLGSGSSSYRFQLQRQNRWRRQLLKVQQKKTDEEAASADAWATAAPAFFFCRITAAPQARRRVMPLFLNKLSLLIRSALKKSAKRKTSWRQTQTKIT